MSTTDERTAGPAAGSGRRIPSVPPPTPPRVTSIPSPGRTGTPSSLSRPSAATSESWSTWVPSTRPPTAYSG